MNHPRRVSRAAISVAALLVGLAGPWAAVSAQETAQAGTLPGGVSYTIRPDPAQPAAAVALWYRAPASGFDAKPVPGMARLAAATIAASTPITGTSLGKLIQRAGGRLSVTAYPDSVAVTALIAPDRVAGVVRAMTADYFAPVTDAAGFRLAQREVAEEALVRSYDPPGAIEDALGAALFADGPFNAGTLASVKAIQGVTLERVRAFAERAFRPANAILVLTGNVDPSALTAVANRDGAQPTAEAPSVQTARLPSPLTRNGNIEGSGLAWAGPPIADEAAATALDFVADALFAPKIGTIQRVLAVQKVVVTGKFVTYRNPGVFLVTLSGADAATARPLVEAMIADAAKPMAPAAFAAARTAFVYHLLSEMETPVELSDTYGWYAVEGNPGYAPADGGVRGRYFSLAAGLTPETVAAAVSRYLGRPPAVVTLVRSAEPAVEKRS